MSNRAATLGPRGLPFVGMTPRMTRDPLSFLQGLARDYGDIVPFRTFNRPAFLINHPDYVKEILITKQNGFTKSPAVERVKMFLGEGLLTSEGDYHTRHRRLLQPAFHRDRLKAYGTIMRSYAAQACERLLPGSEINIRDEMMRLTLAIVARTLFDADVEGDAKTIGQAMQDVLASFQIIRPPVLNIFKWFKAPEDDRAQSALAAVHEIVDRMIREHRAAARDEASGGDKDLLSTLLATRDEDGSQLPDEQIHDEIMNLFVAGHETTALTLTWTWYLLAKNPASEAMLHSEVDRVLGGRLPDFDDLPKLAYVERVVWECLRLYPPVWLLGRIPREQIEIGGMMIPQGGLCFMSPYVTQRNPRFYPDPERFDPERWWPELREARPKFSYFPFGGGKRLCIGERFAMAELVLVIAALAQKLSFRLLDPEPPKLTPGITLIPATPIRMQVVARDLAIA